MALYHSLMRHDMISKIDVSSSILTDPLPSDWPAVVKKNLLSGFTKMVLYGNRANR